MARKSSSKNKGIKLIKKSNQLIESRYKFDIWETRVFLSVLSNIRKPDEDFKVYRIWYKDVIKTFGLKSGQSYELLRDAASGLMRKVFKVSGYEDGFKRETEYHIIRTVNYLAEGQKGGINQEYIDITIDPEMKPLLLQLSEKYTAYDLRNVTKLGAYHVRIYELLKQYQSIGHRTLNVDDIKRMLEITTEYPLFGNFFQKIIKPSVKAINKNTDLIITKLEKVKEGRKVVALYFKFRKKSDEELGKIRGKSTQQRLALNLSEEVKSTKAKKESDRLFNIYYEQVLQSFGFTPSAFLEILQEEENKIDEAMIEQAIRVTRRAKNNNEIKRSVGGFFKHALKGGFTDLKEEEKKLKKEQKAKQAVLQSKLEEIELEKNSKINDKIREVLLENPNLTDHAIEKIKENPLLSQIIVKRQEELGRELELEDFRQDKKLRAMVKRKIMELSDNDFTPILQEYQLKVKTIKKQYS